MNITLTKKNTDFKTPTKETYGLKCVNDCKFIILYVCIAFFQASYVSFGGVLKSVFFFELS